jgi:disulfide bond formation protein DsbB
MLVIPSRRVFLGMFLFIVSIVGFALYLQYVQGIAPCPLCMLQRILFIVIGLVALLAYVHHPMIFGFRKYALVNAFLALCGIGLAGRHLWLESLPPNLAPACGPSLEMMLEYLPLFEVLKTAIMGTGDCAKVAWSMFDLSIASWSMISFVGVFIVSLFVIIRPVGRF